MEHIKPTYAVKIYNDYKLGWYILANGKILSVYTRIMIRMFYIELH